MLLGGAKLAGILLERAGDRIVAGFGVNLAAAPQIEGRATATLAGAITAQAFAPLLSASMDRLLAAWRGASPDAFARAWLARAHPLGTRLSIHGAPERLVTGRFDGLDPDGALRLRVADGEVVTIRAGDVMLGDDDAGHPR